MPRLPALSAVNNRDTLLQRFVGMAILLGCCAALLTGCPSPTPTPYSPPVPTPLPTRGTSDLTKPTPTFTPVKVTVPATVSVVSPQPTRTFTPVKVTVPVIVLPTGTVTTVPVVAPTTRPVEATAVPTPHEDCLPYNPARLRIVDEGKQGWLLTDGSSRMLMLDNQEDAENALALARGHTAHCFIGRDNNRAVRSDYIVEYWEGKSGQATKIGKEDCLSYQRAGLKIVDEGAKGWLLTDGKSAIVLLDDQQDAERALALAKGYSQQCFIGRDNTRANRKDYIVEYWR